MSFDSPTFLFFFLPLLLILEAVIRPVRAKNVFLCAAGLVFYAFGELWAMVLLVVSALVNWLLGMLAQRHQGYDTVFMDPEKARLAAEFARKVNESI